MNRREDWFCASALLLVAVYFGLGVVRPQEQQGLGVAAFDSYEYFYPNVLHAWRSIREGHGLLWNIYQDCGQPFFAISITGLLYPVNLVFALLDREPALIVSLILNLTIAGVGAYLLCRKMGLDRMPALGGAFAFQLGGTALALATWSPMHIAGYAWIPFAMWRTECLLERTSLRSALLLGAVLTVQLLPGFPQISLFTYQLIALRVGWAVLARRTPRLGSLLGALVVAFALPVLLGAVQLIPSMEVARESVRNAPLTLEEMGTGVSWANFRKALAWRIFYPGNLIAVGGAMLAFVGFCRVQTRAMTGFYLLVALLYLILSLGLATPLFGIYLHLPFARTFRDPRRFLWVTGFAVAMLAALGTQAMLQVNGERSVAASTARVGFMLAGLVCFCLLVPNALRQSERKIALAALLLAAVPMMHARLTWLTRIGLPLLIFLNCALIGAYPFQGLRTGDIYGAHADVFGFVRGLLTPQDRVFIVGEHEDLALMDKSASLFRLPSIHDYEPQVSRSYAEFFTLLRTGYPLQSVNDWYFALGPYMSDGFNRRLFDLTAARYLILDHRADRTAAVMPTGVRLRLQNDRLSVYENLQALPRVFFVPRIAIVPEEQVLPLLASGGVDPRRVALVSQAPRSGFQGTSSDAVGRVEIVENDAERVVVRVQAATAGFVFMADQYFPGWTADVNGERTEILRANHTFRLVAVPAGESEVVFRYRPLSLYAGAAVSLITVLTVAAYVYSGGFIPRSSIVRSHNATA